MQFRTLVLVACATLALALSGCSGSTPTKTTSSSSGPSMTAHVEMKLVQFSPKEVTIKAGGKVTWENKESGINHDVTPDDGSNASWNSSGKGGIKPGEQFERTFDAAGTFKYFCQEHGKSMSGTVTVVA